MKVVEKALPKKFNFTKKDIEKIPPPDNVKQYYYNDAQTRGLELSVSKNGNKSFVYRRKEDGISKRRFLGYFPDMSIDQARAKASEYNALVVNGGSPFKENMAAKQEQTLAELFEAYMQRHVVKSRKQVDETRKNFERWLGSISRRRVSSIDRHDAEKLHGELNKERGPYSANRAIQLARAVYNKAIQWKFYSGDNPFSGITLHQEHKRDRFLSDEEAGRLMKALGSLPEIDEDLRALRDFILLDLFTGVRKSNLLAMRWDELVLPSKEGGVGTWTIEDKKMKNMAGQLIPLGPAELKILNERRELQRKSGVVCPFVFPGTGKTGHLTDIKKSWTTLRKKVGIEDVTIHDLRRSLAATMASQNVNVALIKGALNHKDMKTTLGVYALTSKQAELEARQRAQTVWLEAAKRSPEKDNVQPLVRAKSN